MNRYLLTSGVRGLAPDGVPRGKAPWRFAASAGLLASAVLCGCALLPGRITPTGADAQPVPLRDKLGAHLLVLVEDHAAGDLERASSYAHSKGLELRQGRVSVQVLAASEQDVPDLERHIQSVGGSVQSRFENSIFAAIPLPALGAFAADAAVWRIDAEQRVFSPHPPNTANPQRSREENQ